MGGHFALSVRQQARLELTGFDGTLVCTVVRGGIALGKADLQGRLGWIFGTEGQGVSVEAARHTDLKVSIPMVDGTESLNVAAAAAVCFYDAARRRAV
jgi:TrmH family RNA methyltransferase